MSKPYEPILKFWFGVEDFNDLYSDKYENKISLWYGNSKQTDDYIRDNFMNFLHDAEQDKLNEWKAEARGSLAIIILLDQFSRNVYRGSGKMFSNDTKAVTHSKELAKDENKVNELSLIEQKFVYMPFMHSEDISDLEEGLRVYKGLVEKAPESKKQTFLGVVKFCQEHYDVVKRFNRFPHRNELLGRTSTDEEIEFLATSSTGFMKSVKPASTNN